MGDDELRRHLADILLCCGVPAGQANTVAVNRLRLVVDMATRGLLARLPPADDDTPVDVEWLAAELGRKHSLAPITGGEWGELIVSAALRSPAGETLWTFTRQKWVRVPFARLTRGHVRQLRALLAALGVG